MVKLFPVTVPEMNFRITRLINRYTCQEQAFVGSCHLSPIGLADTKVWDRLSAIDYRADILVELRGNDPRHQHCKCRVCPIQQPRIFY